MSDINAVLAKSVITSDYLQKNALPNYESERQTKIKRRLLREMDKGGKWYSLPATKQTPEINNDLTLVKMMSSLYPKNYYKKNDWKTLPKYFQVGTVMDNPYDHYDRLSHRLRKQTIAEQILAEPEFKTHFDKKYREMKEKTQILRSKKSTKHENRSKGGKNSALNAKIPHKVKNKKRKKTKR